MSVTYPTRPNLDVIEDQWLETCLNMFDHDVSVFEYEATILHTYLSRYITFTLSTQCYFFFCITAPYSCIGNKALERVFHQSGRNSTPVINSQRDFEFEDTLIRSRELVELKIRTTGKALDIIVLLDVVDVEIPALLWLYVLDGDS